MNTTVQALLGLYVTLGGKLTDTYPDIADGTVGNYTLIPDCIKAVAKIANGAGVKQMHWSYQTGGDFPKEVETDMTVDEVLQVFENGGTVIAVLTEDGKLEGDILSPNNISLSDRRMIFCNPNAPTVSLYWDESSKKWLFVN